MLDQLIRDYTANSTPSRACRITRKNDRQPQTAGGGRPPRSRMRGRFPSGARRPRRTLPRPTSPVERQPPNKAIRQSRQDHAPESEFLRGAGGGRLGSQERRPRELTDKTKDGLDELPGEAGNSRPEAPKRANSQPAKMARARNCKSAAAAEERVGPGPDKRAESLRGTVAKAAMARGMEEVSWLRRSRSSSRSSRPRVSDLNGRCQAPEGRATEEHG